MPIWLIQIVVAIVFTVASTLIKQATSPAATTTQAASGMRSTYQTGGSVPLSFVVGTFGLPGKLEYENTWGNVNQTPNAYRTTVLSISDVPCSALIGLFADSERQTLPGTGHTTQGYPVTGSRGGNLWYEFYDGTQTTASSFLTTQFGSDANRPWLSDQVGRGVAYVTLTALWDRTVWPGDPTYMLEVQGIKLYDPRQDSTAGGSGTQRRATPSTWAFSDNPAVIIYNILIGIQYGGSWLWGMQDNVDPSRLPYAVWAAAMNACDASVSLVAGGTEKRFRVGREITVDEQPIDVITELLVACNGRISEAAGVYSIVVGAPGSAVGSLNDDDVIITETSSLEPFPLLDEIVNGAAATYLEPTQAWESKEAVPYYRSDLETEDDGRRQALSLTLTSVFSGTQAQRILKATVEDGRRFYRHVLVLRPGFGLYQPIDVLAFTSAKNGYSAKAFLVTSTEEGPNGNVVFGLQEIDSSDHNWTPGTDEKAYSFAALTPVRPPTQTLTGWSASPADFVDGSGTARRPGIAVTWDSGQVDVRAVLVSVREKASGKVEWTGEFNYATYPSGGVIPHAFLPATLYQAQGDYIPYSGRAHTPSSWLDVTTNNVPIAIVDFGPQILALLSYFETAIPDVQETLAKIGAALDGQDVSNFTDKQQLRQEVAAQFGTTNANVTQLFAAATSATEALAEIVTDVKAGVGTATAEIGIEQQARSDGDTAIASSVAIETAQRISSDNTLAASVVTEGVARISGDAAEASARTTAIAAIGSAIASGQFVIDAEAGIGGATTTIALRAKASSGATKATTGILLLASADGLGGTTSQIALQTGQLFIVDALGNVSTALTFDTSTGVLTAASINLGSGAVTMDATGITVIG